jgi:hypothetical protein
LMIDGLMPRRHPVRPVKRAATSATH